MELATRRDCTIKWKLGVTSGKLQVAPHKEKNVLHTRSTSICMIRAVYTWVRIENQWVPLRQGSKCHVGRKNSNSRPICFVRWRLNIRIQSGHFNRNEAGQKRSKQQRAASPIVPRFDFVIWITYEHAEIFVCSQGTELKKPLASRRYDIDFPTATPQTTI